MVLKSNMTHILAVDDDDRIRQLLARYLSNQGYIVITAEDAMQARSIQKQYDFDLCVLDVMMPGENGVELSKFIQSSYDIPVLLLTAMADPADRIAGLEAGVDDYLVKPFEPKELSLRIQAILKRTHKNVPSLSSKHEDIQLEGMRFNLNEGALMRDNGDAIALTEGDKAVLSILAQKPNMPVRRELLATQLGMEGNDRAVDVQITRLRKKIEANPSDPKIIQTLRGRGYMLRVISS